MTILALAQKRDTVLTPTQARVAALVAEGCSNKAIAATLVIAETTVKVHVRRIAKRWQLDQTRNIRVQIARRVLAS